MMCQRPLVGFALLLACCNCISAQEGVTFTNQVGTFTNLQGVPYRNVRLVRADLDGIIYREGVSGGRVCYTNLPAVFLESLGISSNQVAVAKARADHRAVAAACYRQRLQQQAQEEMAAKVLLKQLRDLAVPLEWQVVQGRRDGALIENRILSGRQSTRQPGTYSAGIAEIMKMLEAGIDAQVILAYIQNSPIPYDLDAAELIALKEHEASTELLVALLHHGDELRLQLAQAQSATNPPPVAPAYDSAPQAAYPAYPSDYPDASYAPSPATDYSYAYGGPLAYLLAVRTGGYGPHGYTHGRIPAPSSGHMTSPVVHSGGSRSSGPSGGWSGGPSR